jgi:hypothetical protein
MDQGKLNLVKLEFYIKKYQLLFVFCFFFFFGGGGGGGGYIDDHALTRISDHLDPITNQNYITILFF